MSDSHVTATLRFKLPEARQEFELASRAGEFATAWRELKEIMFERRKHGQNVSDIEHDVLTKVIEHMASLEVEYRLPIE